MHHVKSQDHFLVRSDHEKSTCNPKFSTPLLSIGEVFAEIALESIINFWDVEADTKTIWFSFGFYRD